MNTIAILPGGRKICATKYCNKGRSQRDTTLKIYDYYKMKKFPENESSTKLDIPRNLTTQQIAISGFYDIKSPPPNNKNNLLLIAAITIDLYENLLHIKRQLMKLKSGKNVLLSFYPSNYTFSCVL